VTGYELEKQTKERKGR